MAGEAGTAVAAANPYAAMFSSALGAASGGTSSASGKQDVTTSGIDFRKNITFGGGAITSTGDTSSSTPQEMQWMIIGLVGVLLWRAMRKS